VALDSAEQIQSKLTLFVRGVLNNAEYLHSKLTVFVRMALHSVEYIQCTLILFLRRVLHSAEYMQCELALFARRVMHSAKHIYVYGKPSLFVRLVLQRTYIECIKLALFCQGGSVQSEFPMVSSSSSTLEEPIWVSEEPKWQKAKQSEKIS
jgi:hypothetical protein